MTDLEIARTIRLRPIRELAGTLGLADGDLLSYGPYKAKINLGVWDRLRLQPEGKLILVTGMTPTPAGEGKTTVSIGLAQALCRLGHKAVAALREPSLGPCMGLKGGATGGGYAQVLPMEDINLHFTGDLHAVSSAHNLLAAMVDNHLHHGNALGLDPRRVSWRRAVDMNDRALRQIVAGLGGRGGGVPREAGFDITAASEVMAILCLASGYRDLVDRLGRIQVGLTFDGRPVTARDLRAAGAMGALLRDALSPNLVQTAENTPALVHGGPFANIAHGCSSLMATRMGLRLADYVVTEAGFGADLGAEKFFNIKCRIGNLQPRAAVLVATVKAVKYQGTSGKAAGEHGEKGQAALRDGFRNLARHIRNVRRFGVPVVVAVNRFPSDEQEDLAQLEALCRELGVEAVPVEVWESGGEGGIALARAVLDVLEGDASEFRFLYDDRSSLAEKIAVIAREMYGAAEVGFTGPARRTLLELEARDLGTLPVCIAKTQYSFSGDPALKGCPEGFELKIREVRLAAGAGFIVALAGEVHTMPGLPEQPAAERVELGGNGEISGLF